MSNASGTASASKRRQVAAELSSLAAAPNPPVSTRRSNGENRVARNTRLISEIAARLSVVMDFGEVEELELYTIGQLADYLKVSLRTLRFYEQSGLLRPVREGNRRLYSRRDLDQLRVIVTLRELEASLGAIKALMTRLKDLDDVGAMIAAIEEMLQANATSNQERIGELQRLNGRIETTLGVLTRHR